MRRVTAACHGAGLGNPAFLRLGGGAEWRKASGSR